ncbi:FimV/HubP family polar landmark protein [Marinobacter halotolerans]|uniref:FimV/HubP family polar landmark protein n=1 Tax=Marinobacter halotolerans TaxID=1569211 RepID=UPI001243A958|nr:FimV/HubP family polar landmark protein [Marinobacter halotolerans]
MKVRKLAVALALAGGLGSGVAQALGLGEIELQSYLNEPLDAEIDLRQSEGIAPGNVFVNLAPQSAFDRVGIDRNYFLTKLDFQVTTAPNGSLVVNVSSREPVREPYINLLIEVTWPNGRLMREYALLVDPPVYSEESGVEEQVSAPTVTQARQPEPQARQTAPQTTRSTAPARTSGARTLGPTNSSDTLWTIAAQVRPSNDVTMQQVMLAIQDLNPNAFIDGNINRLMRGEILRIPSENQIRSRSRAEANREVAIQNRAFSTPDRTVDATADAGTGQDAAAGGAAGGDQLRLLAADDAASRDATEGGSAGGGGELPGGADAGTAVAMEQLESARRENEELTGRVDDLQDQVQTLQRLLELKNSQLAEMQDAQVDGEQPQATDAAEPAATADPGDTAETAETADAADSQAMDQEPGAGETDQPEAIDQAAEPETTDDSGMAGGSDMTESSDMAESTEQAEGAAPESAEAPAEPAEPAPAEPAEQEPAQKPFPGNVIDMIANNFIYQIALGGGLILLLLLLLLLARRNANREKAFYEQLNGDSASDDTDSFDLTFDEDEDGSESKEDADAIAEADAYIAYGRNDQAAQTLETAISREPSRADLRLKLLGVYADIQDRESFDKQFREIEALEDEHATAEAENLRSHMDEAESMPSIDDLESQLRSGGSEPEERTSYESDYSLQPEEESELLESEFAETDFEEQEKSDDPEALEEDDIDLEDMDLDLPDTDDTLVEKSVEKSGDDRDDLIEYDLSGLETDEDESDTLDETAETEDGDDEGAFDYSLDEDDLTEEDEDDLSLDFDTSELESEDELDSRAEAAPEKSEEKPATEKADAESEEAGFDGELDESFLDELDAELDKVAGEDEASEEGGESELDDLELDVSDEDLALMEEFSESDDDAPSEKPADSEEDELSLDDELGLEDTLKGEEPADPEQEIEGAEEASEELTEGQPSEAPEEGEPESGSVVPPVASDVASDEEASGRDIDESDLGDDDDFDFLSGTDEAATKLDLARAYVEMGDVDGARDILEEVALEGNEEQKAEAQDLLKNLS